MKPKNLQGQAMTQAKTIKHEEKIAFAQSKACKAFAIVLNTEGKYVIVMGDNQLSKKTFDKIKQAEEFISKKPYELIINAAFAAANFIINQQNNKQNEKTNH